VNDPAASSARPSGPGKPSPAGTSRREALVAAAVGALSIPAILRAGTSAGKSPRAILFLVADGMSLGVPSLAEPFSRALGRGGTRWVELAGRPETARGFFDMASLDSLVTDSAAASSSWGSGCRVDNGAINQLPDGRKLKPLAAVAKEAGWNVGLVTTTRITHATPAGFAANVPDRGLEDEIAAQYLGLVDFLCGGGAAHFGAATRRDGRDLLAEFRAGGYREARDRASLAEIGTGKVLGLFGKSHLPYVIDRAGDPEAEKTVPPLAEMAGAALRHLSGGGTPFLLQIEGGRVDHAAHQNDAAAILHEQLDFDAALGAALRFAEEHPDTLVVATTDHGNGNPGLNGMGPSYSATNACFDLLRSARCSTERLRARCAEAATLAPAEAAERIGELLAEGLGFPVTTGEAALLAGCLAEKKSPKNEKVGPSFDREIGRIAGARTGVGWAGMAHTADWAPILAAGPGAERFSGFLKNTEAFGHLVDLMGGGFRNEGMTPEEALRIRPARGPVVGASGEG
jgi:alkaline phosphatase